MILFIILGIFINTMIGCTKSEDVREISIAEQYGLAYAPLQIMKENKILEKMIPADTEVKWVQLVNTAAIRESMISGDVDIGFMAIPPFLIGWDKGMEWKIATGLSCSPVSLVTYKENVYSIADLKPDDRIALPQPGSIQHILLSMASYELLSDANKFDNQLVTMSHPDGMNALLSKSEITAHFTTPPYLNQVLKVEGMHEILRGSDVIGDFSFIIGASTIDFYEENSELYKLFNQALNKAIEYINNHPEESARILSKLYNISEKDTLAYLNTIEYSSTVKGLRHFSDFMLMQGYIENNYQHVNEILFQGVHYEE